MVYTANIAADHISVWQNHNMFYTAFDNSQDVRLKSDDDNNNNYLALNSAISTNSTTVKLVALLYDWYNAVNLV